MYRIFESCKINKSIEYLGKGVDDIKVRGLERRSASKTYESIKREVGLILMHNMRSYFLNGPLLQQDFHAKQKAYNIVR